MIIKARVMLRLPARIVGTGQVEVTLQNGVYTVHVPTGASGEFQASTLAGRGASSDGELEPIGVGAGLVMTGTTLSVVAGLPGGTEGAFQFKDGVSFNGAPNVHYNEANASLNIGGSGTPGQATPPPLEVVGDAGAKIGVARFSGDQLGPGISMSKSRNTAIGGHTVLQNNDILWDLAANGSDGTEFVFSAAITARVNGTPSAGNVPSDIGFITTNPTLGSVETLKTDFPSTAGQTGLLLWDVDNGTLERVTVGVADSGGAGFKVLRIPN